MDIYVYMDIYIYINYSYIYIYMWIYTIYIYTFECAGMCWASSQVGNRIGQPEDLRTQLGLPMGLPQWINYCWSSKRFGFFLVLYGLILSMPFNPHALSMLVRCAMEVVDCFCFGIFVLFITYKPIKPYKTHKALYKPLIVSYNHPQNDRKVNPHSSSN